MENEQLKLYTNLFNNAPVGYVLFDNNFRIHMANNTFAVSFGKSKEELVSYSVTDFIGTSSIDGFYKDMEALISDKNEKQVQLIIKAKDSEAYVNTVCNIININSYDYIACALMDVTEVMKTTDELEYLSFHDQLTSLYNRRFFEEELNRLNVVRNLPLTIVMADVDGLKFINDNFSHQVGDKLLVKVAEALKTGSREDDIVARVGGDEFVILLPNTSGDDALVIIERIRQILKSKKINSMEISVSFGYCTKNEITEDIQDIYKISEDTMYKMKLNKRHNTRGKVFNREWINRDL